MNELDKLEAYLKAHGYFYERTDIECTLPDISRKECIRRFHHPFDRHQIIVYDCDISDLNEHEQREHIAWDVICHWGSYGYEEGLLEGMGDIFNDGFDVEGHLTAEDVIAKLEKEDNE